MQIVYTSAATQPFPAEALTSLLQKARTRNHIHQVTGILLYHSCSFLQVLEGPERGVTTILNSIEHDPRHAQTKILSRSSRETREFSDWAMGFVDTTHLAPDTPGLIDYQRGLPQLALGSTDAMRYLRFFHQGLCRQVVRS